MTVSDFMEMAEQKTKESIANHDLDLKDIERSYWNKCDFRAVYGADVSSTMFNSNIQVRNRII